MADPFGQIGAATISANAEGLAAAGRNASAAGQNMVAGFSAVSDMLAQKRASDLAKQQFLETVQRNKFEMGKEQAAVLDTYTQRLIEAGKADPTGELGLVKAVRESYRTSLGKIGIREDQMLPVEGSAQTIGAGLAAREFGVSMQKANGVRLSPDDAMFRTPGLAMRRDAPVDSMGIRQLSPVMVNPIRDEDIANAATMASVGVVPPETVQTLQLAKNQPLPMVKMPNGHTLDRIVEGPGGMYGFAAPLPTTRILPNGQAIQTDPRTGAIKAVTPEGLAVPVKSQRYNWRGADGKNYSLTGPPGMTQAQLDASPNKVVAATQPGDLAPRLVETVDANGNRISRLVSPEDLANGVTTRPAENYQPLSDAVVTAIVGDEKRYAKEVDKLSGIASSAKTAPERAIAELNIKKLEYAKAMKAYNDAWFFKGKKPSPSDFGMGDQGSFWSTPTVINPNSNGGKVIDFNSLK